MRAAAMSFWSVTPGVRSTTSSATTASVPFSSQVGAFKPNPSPNPNLSIRAGAAASTTVRCNRRNRAGDGKTRLAPRRPRTGRPSISREGSWFLLAGEPIRARFYRGNRVVMSNDLFIEADRHQSSRDPFHLVRGQLGHLVHLFARDVFVHNGLHWI